jgi:hypothetical protein
MADTAINALFDAVSWRSLKNENPLNRQQSRLPQSQSPMEPVASMVGGSSPSVLEEDCPNPIVSALIPQQHSGAPSDSIPMMVQAITVSPQIFSVVTAPHWKLYVSPNRHPGNPQTMQRTGFQLNFPLDRDVSRPPLSPFFLMLFVYLLRLCLCVCLCA